MADEDFDPEAGPTTAVVAPDVSCVPSTTADGLHATAPSHTLSDLTSAVASVFKRPDMHNAVSAQEWDDSYYDSEDEYEDDDGYGGGYVRSDAYDTGGLTGNDVPLVEGLQASLDTAPGAPVVPLAARAVAGSGGGEHGSGAPRGNRQPVALKDIHAQPREHMLDRYKDKINVQALEAKAVSANRHTGRDDRATVEQVLDPRTRLILFKLLNQNIISEIHGCISTGKEANVYHAFKPDGGELAVKIYKTSILVFKDRDRYVSGEFRFASGYSKSNPRKMVKVWAEKETRNLKRLCAAGIPCPNPFLLRMHVLLMDFMGHDGVAAPRLKDAHLNERQCNEAYLQTVDLMRAMFQRCKLVHADLSEYNM